MKIPSWARADVEQFLRQRHLPGDGLERRVLDPSGRDRIDRDLAGAFDEFRRLDESPRDHAPGLPGVLVLKQPGLKVTTEFSGTAVQGSVDQYIDLPDPTWFSAVFTPGEVLSVWVSRTAHGLVTQGVHLDRRDPGNSYSELRLPPPPA